MSFTKSQKKWGVIPMYESPINIIESAVTELQKQQEEGVFCLIRNYGITVDKEELLKALAYDRDQYNKGYDDGVREFAERVKETKFKHGNEYVIYADNIDQIAKEMGVEL